MTSPTVSLASPDNEILGQLILALESATDPDAVIADFAQRHPSLADQIRLVAATERLIACAAPAPPPARLERGQCLGPFRIKRFITAGGMGEIYEAVQLDLKRSVALKVIRPDKADERRRARFAREREVLAKLHQTHIVPVFASGEENGLQYIAMQYIEGASLGHVVSALRRGDTVLAKTTRRSLAELAKAIHDSEAKAHDANLAGPTESVACGFAGGENRFPSSKRGVGRVESSRPAESDMAGLEDSTRPTRGSLTPEYFRSVAATLADAAEALQAAHDRGICHRDLKPSNLMIEPSGKCWLIDFGLATAPQEAPPVAALRTPERPDAALTQDWLGTPAYMAPEQFALRGDEKLWDVWALGATLYELLTTRPPYGDDTDAAQRNGQPPKSPRTLNETNPRDLDAICMKAMRQEPSERYPSAAAFAADLRRWLAGRSTIARPDWVTLRPARLWAWRNNAWAVLIVICLLSLCAWGFALHRMDRIAVAAANEREQDRHRELLLQGAQRIRLTPHHNGWSGNAWNLVRDAATLRMDHELRTEAAGSLVGLDASLYQEFRSFDSSAVLFDQSGEHLLIGGASKWKGVRGLRDRSPAPAQIWHLTTNEHRASKHVGPGPVAFSNDGTPLQLVVNPKSRLTLWLWDIAKQQLVREFKFPGEEEATPVTALNAPTLALSPDGALLAASAALRDGKETLVAWDTRTGNILRQTAGLEKRISALAVNADAKFLAAGNEEGAITLWPLQAGPAVLLPAYWRAAINCLAIRRGTERSADRNRLASWQLAAGDAAGRVVIWDLEEKIPRTYCRGSTYEAHTLTFSPDGATLASGGRGAVNLWDIATGRAVLSLSGSTCVDFHTGLAFSPNGKKLAVSGRTVFGGEGGVSVFDLEYGRGIQTFGGLGGKVAKVYLSPGGRYLAALSHEWQVGVWDLKTGFLLYILNVPPGFAVDNAALAFNPDAQQLAWVSGKEATLWDLAKGTVLNRWKLPPGLHDALAFDPPGKRLMLCRLETDGGVEPPFGTDVQLHPRVCHVRDLLGPDPVKKPSAKVELNARVIAISTAPDASYFMIATEIPGSSERINTQYEGFSAKKFQFFTSGGHVLDPTGKIVLLAMGNGKWAQVATSSWRLLDSWEERYLSCLSPGARYWGGTIGQYGFFLGRPGVVNPLVTLGIDFQVTSSVNQFSDDGRLVAWGNADGSVLVAHINEVQRRLAELGLGWE